MLETMPAYRTFRIAAVAAALFMLAACAAQPAYKPAARAGGSGYAEQKIDEGRYRVTFTGTSRTPRETVENFLVYRAAEVAIANGYTHFIFASQATESTSRYRSDFSRYPGWGYYWSSWWWDPWALPPGHLSTREEKTYTAYADVVLLKVDEARREPKAFDAKTVVATLGPSVPRGATP